jgi:hypothetical protein
MYRSAVILIVATVLALVVLLVGAQMLAVVEMLAVVDERAGTAQVVRGDEARPAAVGMVVRAGERLRTGSEGRVGLHWADGSRVEVGPDSELVIERCRLNKVRKRHTTHFRLNLGEIWIRLHGVLNPGSKFEVETPTIVAAVRGTIFGVKVFRDGTTRLEVYQGQVDILGDGIGQAVNSGERGQCALVGKGRFDVQRMSDAEVERWHRQTNIVGPLLEVTEPPPDCTTASALTPVSGRTEELTAVAVNGESVAVSAKGTFRTRARLTEGPNVVTIVATLGRLRSSVSRKVSYVNPTRVIALTCRPSDDPHDPAGVVELTAALRDRNGELVSDGTPVEFLADRGFIPRYHRTHRGAVTAKWQPSRDMSPAAKPYGPPRRSSDLATRVTARSGPATAAALVRPCDRLRAAPSRVEGRPSHPQPRSARPR